MNKEEEFSRKLLVEGNDDQHVIWALCEKFHISENFDVVDCGGIENLLNQLPQRLKSDVEVIGIVIDADMDFAARWQQITGILTRNGYPIPPAPTQNGTIITVDDLPRIGVWLMPDNQSEGMLEDFIALLVPEDDALRPFANNVLAEIEAAKAQRYKPVHRSKAWIHTWLAWQKVPGTPMGKAITSKYLENSSNAANFATWLRELFG